jgi:hypothetical protein
MGVRKTVSKNQYFVHYRLSLKDYIIYVAASERHDFSGFFESILTKFGAKFYETSLKQKIY